MCDITGGGKNVRKCENEWWGDPPKKCDIISYRQPLTSLKMCTFGDISVSVSCGHITDT